MMSCYDSEDILAFVDAPLEAKDPVLASHLLVCEKCRGVFLDCLELPSLAESLAYVPSAEEEREIAAMVSGLCNPLWQRFHDGMERLVRSLDACLARGNMFLSMNASMLSAILDPRPAAYRFGAPSSAHGGAGTLPPVEKCPKLRFESLEPRTSSRFWQMTLTFPSLLNEDSFLDLDVKDGAGHPLSSGTLTFLGQSHEVAGGMVSISFKDFRDNLASKLISYQFGDGTESPGTISFFGSEEEH